MISTSAVSLRRLTLFDDTLKNLRGGLDEGPIIPFLIILAAPQENCPFYCSLSIMDILDNMNFNYGDVERQYNEVKIELILLPEVNDVMHEVDFVNHQDTNEEMLAKIIMWLLGQDTISNKQIKDHFEMGYDRAKTFLNKLESFNLVTNQRAGSKLARTVIPKSMDDIPAKVMEILMKCGYTY